MGWFWGPPLYMGRALILVAILWGVGHSVTRGYHWQQVPVSTVDQTLCVQGGNGPVVQVWEWTGERGVFHVHCKNGIKGIEGYK